jgi:hypothetical protein
MATLKQLHELIHALDKNEKKYISLMIEGTGGKAKARYADAFQDVNCVKKFDALKLKALLALGVRGMNLSEANTNFYKFVCRALISYHSTDNGNIGLQKQLLLIEILMNKALYETAYQMLLDLLPKLKSGGTFSLLHRANELQSNIFINYKELNKNYEDRYLLFKERLKDIDEHRQFVEITQLNMRFFQLAQSIGDPRTKAQQQQYISLAKDPLINLDAHQINVRSLATFIPLKLTLKELSGEQIDMFELGQKLRVAIRSMNMQRGVHLQDFMILDFMASMALQKKNELQTIELKEELSALLNSIHQKGIQSKVLNRILMMELSLCFYKKDFTRTEVVLKKWMAPSVRSQWISANLSYVNLLLAARLLYLSGKPDKALDYLLQMQVYERTLRPNIYMSYRFLILLCHYKLKNYQFLLHATESLYRYLLKLDKLYAPERALLRFVKKCDHFEKVKKEMRILYASFREMERDPLNSPFFSNGDYLEWLSMDLTGINY